MSVDNAQTDVERNYALPVHLDRRHLLLDDILHPPQVVSAGDPWPLPDNHSPLQSHSLSSLLSVGRSFCTAHFVKIDQLLAFNQASEFEKLSSFSHFSYRPGAQSHKSQIKSQVTV